MHTIATFTAAATANTAAATIVVTEDPKYGWFYVHVQGRKLFEEPLVFQRSALTREQWATKHLEQALVYAAKQVQAALTGELVPFQS